MTAQAEPETFSFQAEVVQILDLMVHSLYSNKEIFLRELISNASDAIDRLRLELMSKSESPDDEGPLQIRVRYDADAGTITVADNGIGMSRAEVIEHIGTIAKSGTRDFLHQLTGDQREDASLIGQFGVGFYASFIVADRVVLTTRRAGLPASEGAHWESDGRGAYTLEPAEVPARGTTIVLHLRDGEDELLNGPRLRSIIQTYSDHISLPIMMPAMRTDGGAGTDGEAGPPGEVPGEVPGQAPEEAPEEPVNQASALWARSKSDISDQDYRDFYRHLTGDVADPLVWLHSKMEGTFEYTLLLFIPGSAPFDLWIPDASHGVKLHVQRVFIMADSGQLMPSYLRFVRGVIDSSDLPLNVSRELLQGSRAVSHIRSSAVKKVLKLLADLAANEPEKYAMFWAQFGAVLKEGIPEDYANRDELARLLRFTSTETAGSSGPSGSSGSSGSLGASGSPGGGPGVSLSEYVARMKEGQDRIYYLLAPGPAAASSPHLEAFRAKGVEVLLLNEPVDSWVVSSLHEFEGKRLQSVAQGAPDFGTLEDEAEHEATEKAATEFAPLLARLKEILAGKVYDVRVTSRLTTSPACIVANEQEIEINLARRMRGSGLPSQAVLEINPQHPLVDRLNREQDDARLADWAHVLYNQSVLTLGAQIEDPAAFVSQLNELLVALADK
jgi:molecular chaperone HtpG